MIKCPKCNLEINEDVMYCPMCNTELLEQIQKDSALDAEPVETALLMTAKDELQANIVESLLDAYGIPMRRTFKGNDTFGKIVMGLTVNGIDLYVPKSALEEAKGIIENEMPEEVELELEEMEESEEEIEALQEKYENKRRVHAWISLLFFVPSIVVLAGVAIYWIINMFL